MPTGKPYSNKDNEKMIKKAVKEGLITQKQMDKMSEGLLLGIIKKGGNGGKKKK